jgi:hypothetical protein
MALGSLQPLNPALAGFDIGCEDKPQPCWHGIVPGFTTVEEAQGILENMSYVCASVRHLCARPATGMECPSVAWWGFENQLTGLDLLDCGDLTLGSVITALGSPDRIIHFCDGFVDIIWDDFAKVTVYLTENSRLWFAPTDLPSDLAISPSQLEFGPDHPFAGSVYPWQGFMPFTDYLQSQPNPTCVPLE